MSPTDTTDKSKYYIRLFILRDVPFNLIVFLPAGVRTVLENYLRPVLFPRSVPQPRNIFLSPLASRYDYRVRSASLNRQ